MDNIMLFPALLASWRLLLMRPRVLEIALTSLMTISLWMPQRLLDAVPGTAMAQSLIWLILGAVLVWELRAASSVKRELPEPVSWSQGCPGA